MDKQFLKELKNKRKTYTDSFVKIKDIHEWNNFINHVKQELLDNPDQTTMGISIESDYWPRSQSGDLIKPGNLVLALQHELRLKCEYNDSNVIIDTQQRVRWWRYFPPTLEVILTAVFAMGILIFCSWMNPNKWVQIVMVSLAIILFLCALGRSSLVLDNLPYETRCQEKELFGKR